MKITEQFNILKALLILFFIYLLFWIIPNADSRTKIEKIKDGVYILTKDNIRIKRESIDFRGHEYIEVTKFSLEHDGLGVAIVHDQACSHPKHNGEIF